MNHLLKRIEKINIKGNISIDEVNTTFKFNAKNNTFDSSLTARFEERASICDIPFATERALENAISYLEKNPNCRISDIWNIHK